MAKATIKVHIKGGKASIEVKGVKGPMCKDLTANLEAALGDIETDTETEEFLEEPEVEQEGQIEGGL